MGVWVSCGNLFWEGGGEEKGLDGQEMIMLRLDLKRSVKY